MPNWVSDLYWSLYLSGIHLDVAVKMGVKKTCV